MPHHVLLDDKIDLRIPPTKREDIDFSDKTVALPDSHGNAVKFLYSLVQIGVVTLENKTYINIFNDYNKLEKEPKNQEVFNALIRRLTTSLTFHPEAVSKLIDLGDKYADRGVNDALTARLHQGMADAGVNFTILFSNHDWMMINAYFGFQTSWQINPTQCRSWSAWCKLITKDPSESEFFGTFMQTTYLPRLQLVAADLAQDNTMYVYTHTPLNTGLLTDLTESFGLTFSLSNTDEFRESLKKLNQYFSKNRQWILGSCNTSSPLFHFAWDRKLMTRQAFLKDKTPLISVCGHTSAPEILSTPDHYILLDRDNMLGKLSGPKRIGYSPLLCVSKDEDLAQTAGETKKNSLIRKLNSYLLTRNQERYTLFGYTKASKLEAANALLRILRENSSESLRHHHGSLTNARLGKIIASYAKSLGYADAKACLNNLESPAKNEDPEPTDSAASSSAGPR